MNPTLPPIDPIPLPAPVWLFQVLSFVTLFLHIVAMNFLMGGGVIAAVSGLRGRSGVPHHRRLSDLLFRSLPIVNAATITLGVAPLLFLQVLYGRFFYTSSILIAFPWISIVALLCLAYYGHYFMSMSETVRREKYLWIAWAASVLVMIVGFIYSNNITLMESPERFRDLYLADRSGLRLNFGEPTLVPRFLHFFVAALAVAGLGVVAFGQRARRPGQEGFSSWAVRYGRNWFAGATLVQLLVGFWFLLSQPAAIRDSFLGGNVVHTAHLFAAVFLALVAALLLMAKPESGRVLLASSGLLTATILVMLLVRSWTRELRIGALAGFGEMQVRTQGSVLAIFLLLFVASLVTVAWMIRRYVRQGSGAA